MSHFTVADLVPAPISPGLVVARRRRTEPPVRAASRELRARLRTLRALRDDDSR